MEIQLLSALLSSSKKIASNLAKKYQKDLIFSEFVSEIVSFKFQAKSLVGVCKLKKNGPSQNFTAYSFI